jgi:hypothetical protein
MKAKEIAGLKWLPEILQQNTVSTQRASKVLPTPELDSTKTMVSNIVPMHSYKSLAKLTLNVWQQPWSFPIVLLI